MPLKSEQINPFDKLKINELLVRGIAKVIPSKEALKQALAGGKKLTVYLGVDPTGPHLHLGHSVPLLLLRRFQKLGHKTVLLIGDFTARIGDPSGKTTQRRPLSEKEIETNLANYKEQASKLLDFSSTRIEFNSTWLKKLTYGELTRITSSFTVQQMLARDMFQERMKNEQPISLNEFLYPIAQGYDSVALKTDAEIGASDQLFNMLVGRDMVREYLGKEKFVVTTKLLVNPETGKKMSKSEGSFIALGDAPNEMYGKIMAFPDELMRDCLELCTEVTIGEIGKIMKLPPRDAKAKLAQTIVSMYHGEEAARGAEREFTKVFSARELPQDVPAVKISAKTKNIVDLLLEIKLTSSKSEARRLVEQGGVRIDGGVARDPMQDIDLRDGMVVQVGKRKFARLALR